MSIELLDQLDSLIEPFEAALKEGLSPRIEESMAQAPPELTEMLFHELLQLETGALQRNGEPVPSDEYQQRFPQFSDIIQKHFESPEVDLGETVIDPSDVAKPNANDLPASIGDYEVDSVLGRGGMGVVLKARDLTLDRFVAIKILNHRPTAAGSVHERFLTEARAFAAVRHPNVVPIFAVEAQHDPPFLVLEFVPSNK